MLKRTDPNLEEVKRRLLERGDFFEELEAIGIIGSLARGDFSERSDIDVFVVIREENDQEGVDEMWYHRVRELLQDFRRDVTVLVYTVEGLKEVPTWHTLRLASEAVMAYDRGNVGEILKRLTKKAREAGLIERKPGGKKVWMMGRALKRGEVIEVKLE